MKKFYFLILLVLILISSSCAKKLRYGGSLFSPGDYTHYEIDKLMRMMTGSFDSYIQAELDSNYYNISLEMHPIWTDRKGHWLYVEQALASKKDKPYRQRIYKLWYDSESDQFISEVYKLPEEKTFIGQWDSAVFDDLNEEDLILRNGCAVYLKKNPEGFYEGNTNESDCESTLRGASYATSIVGIYSDRIKSWDQGFNEDGEQVWGATEGPYIFDKIK